MKLIKMMKLMKSYHNFVYLKERKQLILFGLSFLIVALADVIRTNVMNYELQ